MNKTYSNLIRKAFASFKILALGTMLFAGAGILKAQNNLNMRFYEAVSGSGRRLDVSVLDNIFGTVNVNGTPRTADMVGSDLFIADLPTTVNGYSNIQVVAVNGFLDIISQAQADALVAYVKQGGILLGSMEGVRIGTASGTDVNKFIGESLLLQGVTITATAGNSPGVPSSASTYHNNGGVLNLNASATTVFTTTTSSYFTSGVPRESVVFSFVKPTSTGTCNTSTLDFIAPSYPGDVNAISAGINGFAYLSGEIEGPLGASPATSMSRNNSQANINLAQMIYDFLYIPVAMSTRRAWSKTAANVNSFCPVSTTSLECRAGYTAPPLTGTALSNTCPTTTVNLNSLHTATVPSGSSLVWFNNNTHASTAISNPAAVGTPGTYYAFYYDSTNNCYSPASNAVTVTINCCLSTGPSIN